MEPRWAFLLQGPRAAGQNAAAERESGRIGAEAGGAPTPTRPSPEPASAAPEWERGQSPGLNAKRQTAVFEGARRHGVRAGCGSRTSLGGEGSAQPAPSPPLGSSILPEGPRAGETPPSSGPADLWQLGGVPRLGARLCPQGGPPAPCSPWPASPAKKALRQDFKGMNSAGSKGNTLETYTGRGRGVGRGRPRGSHALVTGFH